MAVYAHPDDEGQVAGTLAAFLDAGHRVTLVCATRGEVGEISDPTLATAETLWYTRELELRAAMAQIGLADVRFLPFRDSGMENTPENEDERSLHQQPPEVVVPQLLEIMREVRPHLVLTWDPSGGYGHPDHLAVHRHMLDAFDACGDSEAYPDSGAAWTPERLYWGGFTIKRFAAIFREIERRGIEMPEMDSRIRERFEAAMEEPDPPVSIVNDVSRYVELKRLASSMHRSQFGEGSAFSRIPDDLRDQLYGEERFFQARPEWPADASPLDRFPEL